MLYLFGTCEHQRNDQSMNEEADLLTNTGFQTSYRGSHVWKVNVGPVERHCPRYCLPVQRVPMQRFRVYFIINEFKR